MTVVRHDQDWHRVVTACECGETVNLPDHGLSYTFCRCGRAWKCDGDNLAMYVPKGWIPPGGGIADGSGEDPKN